MTYDQLQTLVGLLGIDGSLVCAVRGHLFDGQPHKEAAHARGIDPALLRRAIDQLTEAEFRIRSAFVCHTPGCWEIIVGHGDHHRAPGRIALAVGDEVRLVCMRVSVMVPVKVTQRPDSPHGYYRGVVLGMEHSSMRYHRGDGVMFSDDQAVLSAGSRKPRRPIPV